MLPARVLHARQDLPHPDRYLFLTDGPLPPTPSWDAKGDQAGAHLGRTVSTAGDVNGDGYADVLVGAPGYDVGELEDAGRVYLYYGGPDGLARQPAWFASGDQAGANLGGAIGTAGDVNCDGYADVILGAWGYSHGQAQEGRAYVYYGSATGLKSRADWQAESNQAGADFGFAVSTAGDVNGDGCSDVIVSAPTYNGAGGTPQDQGRIYLYHGSPSGLETTPAWTDEGGQAGARLGYDVDTAGDVNGDGYADVIAGARYYDGGQPDEGQVRVYYGSAAGLSLAADWAAESNQARAYLGTAVAAAGDVNGDGYADVIAGAPGCEGTQNGAQVDEGCALVYYGSSTGLSGGAAGWRAESDQESALLGWAVGPAGDVNGDGLADLIVGARHYRTSYWKEGQVSVYLGALAGLGPIAGWTVAGGRSGVELGMAVDTAGDVNGDGYADVIVGASAYTDAYEGQGRAMVYHGGSTALKAGEADWVVQGYQDKAAFGAALAGAGDVNGDGYGDVIVGAPDQSLPGQTHAGRATVYHGGPLGLTTLSADWTVGGSQGGARLGAAVSAAGDVDGDGYADVIVGAPGVNRAYVYRGSVTGLSTNPAWTLVGPAGSEFGAAVATAGDVNGDGCADVAVGAPAGGAGRVYLYYGSTSGLSEQADAVIAGSQDGSRLGAAVSAAGDVDGDGYSDLIVGAPHHRGARWRSGQARLYTGSPTGIDASAAAWSVQGILENGLLGAAVSTAGDVDGDGYADLLIGAPGETPRGRVYLYYGRASGPSTQADWTATGPESESCFGCALGAAGDVNGDGYADVLIGAPESSNNKPAVGRAALYLGGAAGLGSGEQWSTRGGQAEARLGAALSTAGDVDGDGYADVLLGVPGQLTEPENPGDATYRVGATWLYYGNSSLGLSLNPRQMRATGAAPLAPQGMSDSGTAVQLWLTGRMPAGRERVRLHWQVAPLGVPFDQEGMASGSSAAWIDTGSSGVEILQPVSGLSPSTPYHWRARLLYPPGTRLGQSASRWLYPAAAGQTAQSFRTGYPRVSFAAPLYRVSEGAGRAAITVTLNVAAGLVARVDYATAPGSATEGEDYVPISGTLTFVPGQQIRVLEVPLLDDARAEGDEQLALTLSQPQNATLGSIALATLVLLDDDGPGLYFEQARYSVREDAGTAEIGVRLSAVLSVPVTVDYATLEGSAREGEDYTAAAGTLRFAPGETRAVLQVSLLDDARPEPDEMLSVWLHNAVNAHVSGPNPATLWIVNDDPMATWLPIVVRGR